MNKEIINNSKILNVLLFVCPNEESVVIEEHKLVLYNKTVKFWDSINTMKGYCVIKNITWEEKSKHYKYTTFAGKYV